MKIQRQESENKGMFYVGDEQSPMAGLYFHMFSPERMIIDHTEVSDELTGKNVGYQLVRAAVEYARANNIRIKPLCSFAKSVFDKKPEFHDVL